MSAMGLGNAMEAEEEKPTEPCLTYTTHHAVYNAKQCKARGKRMTARALLKACEKMLWGFVIEAPQDVSCDDYCASLLSGLNVVHPYDIVFVEQVLYGCCRYNKMLSIFVSKFFKCKSGCTQPSDGFLYTLLAYIILIRLDELTFPNLRLLILSQSAQKMLPFVQFIFSVKYLSEECKSEWLKLYDIEFIDEIINNIAAYSAEAAELEARVAERVFVKEVRDGRKTTPQPFKLSVCPRPKPQPKKEVPPAPFKAKPPPKFIRRGSRTVEQKAIEASSLENKKRQTDFYTNPQNQPFRLRSLERPTNLEHVREEVEHQRAVENKYIPPKVSKVPEPPRKEVHMTAAAVLREHALYQKQVDADKRRVQAFESELRDEASFKAWQEEERARYELGVALELRFRRDSVCAIAQAIQEARETVVKEKQEMADDVRAEAQILTAKREEFEMNVELLNRLRHESVLEERAASKEAVNKVTEEKKTKALEIQEQTNIFHAERDYTRAVELKIKQELVRQLHDLEMAFQREVKKFDPDTAYDHGLLEGMSITELRRRLEYVKIAFQREVQARQDKIATFKEGRRNFLLEKSEFVRRMREVTRIEQVSKRETKKRTRPSTATTLAAIASLTAPPVPPTAEAPAAPA